jgi:hypothetical protein
MSAAAAVAVAAAGGTNASPPGAILRPIDKQAPVIGIRRDRGFLLFEFARA